jgi:lipopolysaccharide export LptBFGC system permease protein LptF
MTGIDLTPLLQALIALLSAAVTLKLIPWLNAKTRAQHAALTGATIKTLVFAAEQLFKSGEGTQKIEYVKEELTRRGFAVDLSAIEAAVRELTLLGRE